MSPFNARLTRAMSVAVIAAALASAAIAAPAARPFEAKLTLTETVQFTGMPPCFGIGSIQAVGQAAHLGSVTATSTDCINPIGGFNPAGPNSFAFSNLGSGPTGLVFTAANGDQLYLSYSGTVTAQATGPHAIAGQFVITGGTGRFYGATGGGTLSGYEDLSQVVSARGEVQAVGTITY